MAHTKAKGSSKLGRDSAAQRLGVKIYGGQKIRAGQIIIRQRGSKFRPGMGASLGVDDTLYAKKDGVVKFTKKDIRLFTGKKVGRTVVSVQ